MLPTFNPAGVAPGTSWLSFFNYTPVIVLGVFVLITIWWLVSARHWFKGPIVQGSEEELEAIEHAVGETHLPEGVEGVAGGGE
jgi:hypothetical protein